MATLLHYFMKARLVYQTPHCENKVSLPKELHRPAEPDDKHSWAFSWAPWLQGFTCVGCWVSLWFQGIRAGTAVLVDGMPAHRSDFFLHSSDHMFDLVNAHWPSYDHHPWNWEISEIQLPWLSPKPRISYVSTNFFWWCAPKLKPLIRKWQTLLCSSPTSMLG